MKTVHSSAEHKKCQAEWLLLGDYRKLDLSESITQTSIVLVLPDKSLRMQVNILQWEPHN